MQKKVRKILAIWNQKKKIEKKKKNKHTIKLKNIMFESKNTSIRIHSGEEEEKRIN